MTPILTAATLAISSSPAALVLAKITLTTALAVAGTRLARKRPAAVRHLILAACFALLALIPVGSVLVPAVLVPVAVAAPAGRPPAPSAAITIEAPAGAALAQDGSGMVTTDISWPSMSAWLVALWFAGAAISLAPLVVGMWRLRKIRRAALPLRAVQSVVDALAVDVGVRRRVDVLLHEAAPGPMTCGAIHPAIVLPADAGAWADDDLHRAIVHELEHVRRADWLTQTVARVVCAAYWFHPLVWIAWRQFLLEAERACDDAVLRRSESTAYADQLVGLAQRLSATSRQPQIAMAGRHDLSRRVVAVLDAGQHRGRAGVRWITLACGASALLVATISPLKLVAGQAPDRAGSPPRFEAASVRPCTVEEAPPGRARGGAGGTNATFSPGRTNVPCVTLEQLIYLAYAGPGATPEEQLVNVVPGQASDTTKIRGGPSWVHSQRDKYAIEATAPGATERYVLLGSMLRTLLEDRFKLKVHRETEEVAMYTMTIAKGGLKLTPMKAGECEPYVAGEERDPAAAKRPCGNLTMGAKGPNTVWSFTGFDLRSLASRLSGALGRHVIDRTGSTDEFIYRFEFHPDENTPGITWPAERESDTSAPQAASIFTALEQQIGVKLEGTKGPRGYLVIDRAERPTPENASGR